MRLNCFRAAAGPSVLGDHNPAPRPRPLSVSSTSASTPTRAKTSRYLHRNASAGSSLSATSSERSNSSIANLPPCRSSAEHEARVATMMMPLPHDPRPSRCLRLSHPRTYADIVTDMKRSKGTRDWRSFAVFDDDDEIDASVSANERARLRARDCQRKMEMFGRSFDSAATTSDGSVSVDMIG